MVSLGCGLFRRRGEVKEMTTAADAEKKNIEEEMDVDDIEDEYEVMLAEANGDVVEDEFQKPPTPETLEELYKVSVLDRNRNKVIFGELIRSKEYKRHLIVFIRHFFCGNCYGYVRALSNEMQPNKLDRLTPKTKLIIIGCGDPILIPKYIEQTGCPFEVYADPSRSLYSKLGFAVTTQPPPQLPRYVNRYSMAFWPNIWRSLKLSTPKGRVSGGPVVQVGGELIWTDGELQHVHRMRNAGDHMDVPELYRLLRKQGRLARLEGNGSIFSEMVMSMNERRRSFTETARKRLSGIFQGRVNGSQLSIDTTLLPSDQGQMSPMDRAQMSPVDRTVTRDTMRSEVSVDTDLGRYMSRGTAWTTMQESDDIAESPAAAGPGGGAPFIRESVLLPASPLWAEGEKGSNRFSAMFRGSRVH